MNPYPELPWSWRNDKDFLALIEKELEMLEKTCAEPTIDRMKPRLIKKAIDTSTEV